jgi:hypothetical protein
MPVSKKPEAAPRKGRSGPSGKGGANLLPRFTLRATQEEFDTWEIKAAWLGVNLTKWIRDVCNKAAKR